MQLLGFRRQMSLLTIAGSPLLRRRLGQPGRRQRFWSRIQIVCRGLSQFEPGLRMLCQGRSMRLILLTTSLVLEFVTAALGQPTPQFEIGPVVRLDSVFVEGGARGGTIVAGVVTSFRISKTYGVEAELTQAWNRIERRYEGWL